MNFIRINSSTVLVEMDLLDFRYAVLHVSRLEDMPPDGLSGHMMRYDTEQALSRTAIPQQHVLYVHFGEETEYARLHWNGNSIERTTLFVLLTKKEKRQLNRVKNKIKKQTRRNRTLVYN